MEAPAYPAQVPPRSLGSDLDATQTRQLSSVEHLD
jgi:hypothetical protein